MAESWHTQLHLPDELRMKATIVAIKKRTTRTAVLTEIITEALADVVIPKELLDDSDNLETTED